MIIPLSLAGLAETHYSASKTARLMIWNRMENWFWMEICMVIERRGKEGAGKTPLKYCTHVHGCSVQSIVKRTCRSTGMYVYMYMYIWEDKRWPYVHDEWELITAWLGHTWNWLHQNHSRRRWHYNCSMLIFCEINSQSILSWTSNHTTTRVERPPGEAICYWVNRLDRALLLLRVRGWRGMWLGVVTVVWIVGNSLQYCNYKGWHINYMIMRDLVNKSIQHTWYFK